jgi:DNA adenine methylase
MEITALAPWFGGARSLAARIGPELGRLGWCGVLFAGGMPELPHIKTQAGVATDLHRHIINLARVVADDAMLVRMVRRVDRLLFHSDVLEAAQRRCLDREHTTGRGMLFAAPQCDDTPNVEWAADYFVSCWMGRGGYAGRGGELSQSIAVRYTSSGGSSAKRWRSAVASLPAWGKVLERWQFVCDDAFNVLARLKPQAKAGLYLDPPWVGAGDEYVFRFTDEQHRRLARELTRLSAAGYRIVLRYGDHPMIRGLYPTPEWTWVESTTRDQRNGEVAEVLILNGPSYAEPAHA